MRTVGVLGGMSWTSTMEYYRLLNEGVEARLGGLHSARVLLHSVDFAPVTDFEHAGDWDGMAEVLVDATVAAGAWDDGIAGASIALTESGSDQTTCAGHAVDLTFTTGLG